MANTIKMALGDLLADVNNSELDIKLAERQGYHVVKEEKKPVEKVENKTTKKVTKK